MGLEQAIWLVEHLGVPASLHDVNGVFVHSNQGAQEASGYSNAELVGRTHLDLVPESERANIRAQFRRAAHEAKPTDFATTFIDAGGQLRGTRAQHLPILDDGVVVGVLIIAFEFFASSLLQGPVPELTARQREVLGLIAAGLSTSETARRLSLSTETVRNHLRAAYKELGAHTRVEAIAAAQRLSLLAAPGLGPSRKRA
ncbi:MAG TPA: helix-turn-helix transcriptional regulator [Gaiellaceae bacterium]|nr:helix-turn-helix transcriptional regulator [Gaiellaceae bacterium]